MKIDSVKLLDEIKSNTTSHNAIVQTLNHARKARLIVEDEATFAVVILKASCWNRREQLQPGYKTLWPSTEFPMAQIWEKQDSGWIIYDHNSYDYLPSKHWEKQILRDNSLG
tara:strand:+ start:8653 stop:8988 length:336 start_codon:yes stop_codon:yes gene_type:complete